MIETYHDLHVYVFLRRRTRPSARRCRPSRPSTPGRPSDRDKWGRHYCGHCKLCFFDRGFLGTNLSKSDNIC